MLRILAIQSDGTILREASLQLLERTEVTWYWVDFSAPDKKEAALLRDYFRFHPLAIKDCFYQLQRPKLVQYENYFFLVLHALTQKNQSEELNLFLGDHMVVTFHQANLEVVDILWQELHEKPAQLKKGPLMVVYKLMDRLVEAYFPPLFQIEDRLNQMESRPSGASTETIINQLFRMRSQLSRLRRSIVPMNELLFQLLNTERFKQKGEQHIYFRHLYHRLDKLSHMLEINRETTSDIRDNYLSLNSFRMNTIMMTLTVITTIFMPLTLIVGIYGMNFDYMPELKWRYGYFAILGVMLILGLGMFWGFKKKGWFDRK